MGTNNVSSGSGQNETKAVPIPDHVLLKCIGRGAYGEVWLARNHMGVYRAVKVVLRSTFDSERPFEREWAGIQKFEPISRSHEGFMDILQVGINHEMGFFYYVMELGDDATSGQKIDPATYQARTLAAELEARKRLPYKECLDMGLALSLALGELHKHKLVHRDIKPANVIYINGVPKLADIGLVTEQALAKSFVGTEGYIPPEGPGTMLADVYGLGKLLYEASTGRDRTDFPELPTEVESLVRNQPFLEFNEILIKACHRDTAVRYPTAREMYYHLLVLADGKSVKRLIELERLVRRLGRFAVVSLAGLIVLAGIGYHLYRESLFRAERHQKLVSEAVDRGLQAMKSGNPIEALPEFAEALRLDQGSSTNEFLHRVRFGSVLAQTPKLTQFWHEEGPVLDGCFDAAGKKILIAQGDGYAKLYDTESGRIIGQPFAADLHITSANISPDGNFAVTAGRHGYPGVVWDLTDNRVICELPHGADVWYVRYSHDGKHIVTAGVDKVAIVWNATTGEREHTLVGHGGPIRYAEFSHDDRMIVTASQDGTAWIWDAQSGNKVYVIHVPAKWVNHAAFSPDDNMIVTADSDMCVRLWHIDGTPFPTVIHHEKLVTSAEFSPDGRWILTASLDGMVTLWDAKTLQPIKQNPVLKLGAYVRLACFSPGGDSVLAVCEDGSVRVWSLAAASLLPVVLQGDICRDGSKCFVTSNDTVEIRETESGKPLGRIQMQGPTGKILATSADGGFFLLSEIHSTGASGKNSFISSWDSKTGKMVGPGVLFSNLVKNAALSDDGKRGIFCWENFVQLWNFESGKPVGQAVLCTTDFGHRDLTCGRTLAVSYCGNEVQVWNSAEGALRFPPLAHPCGVTDAALSPDESRLITTCADNGLTKRFATIWDSRSGKSLFQVGIDDGVLCAAFSPDGERFATGDEDFNAVIWSAKTGRRLTPIMRHREKVRYVRFSLDGRWLLTVSTDNSSQIWDSESGTPVTPPFRHLEPISRAGFIGGNHRIITTAGQGVSWVWPISVEDGPIDEIGRTARLLSNGRSGSTTDPVADRSLEGLWSSFKKRRTAATGTTQEEVLRWHEFVASESEISKNWYAAKFHLQRILETRPQDKSLIERIERASTPLKDKDLPSK